MKFLAVFSLASGQPLAERIVDISESRSRATRSVNMAEQVSQLAEAPPLCALQDLRGMAGVAQNMLRHDPRSSDCPPGLATIFFARQIERLAAHATNVAEMAI